MLLFRFDGVLLLRFAERKFAGLLFQLPPRITRFEPPESAHVRWGSIPSGPVA